MALTAVGDGAHADSSGARLAKGEVLEMNGRFHRRLVDGAAGSDREISDSIRREPAGLQAREPGEIEITSGKIQAERRFRGTAARCTDAGRTDGKVAGQWSIVSTGIDVVELQFAARDAQVALQQWNLHSVGPALVDLEVSIPCRIGARARNAGR